VNLHPVLGVVRGSTFGMLRAPDAFMPQVRALGVHAVRVFLYWSQIEPEPDRFVWDAVDALLTQLEDGDLVWVTVCSSSTWATRRATPALPPSPALEVDRYRRFVARLVRHCQGRIRLWQCDNEPCVPLLWAGSAPEYLEHLDAFWHAVKEADPGAQVVLGGAPPHAVTLDGSTVDAGPVAFFDQLLREGRERFDVFDVHLYGDPYSIPAAIDAWRRRMAAFGYQKPIVAGEYNGPYLGQFPELMPHLGGALLTLRDLLTGQVAPEQSAEQPLGPDESPMVALYERMATLPVAIQMFMDGCPADLEERRHRWNCRDLVIRNLLAASSGVPATFCWNLGPETYGIDARYHILHLLFDKFKLMDYEGQVLRHRYPAAETLSLLAGKLGGVESVRRIVVPEQPELYVFEVQRARRPLMVAWVRCDGLDGEDVPAVPLVCDWTKPEAAAVDAFGAAVPIRVHNGRLHLAVSVTPTFVE